MSDYEIFIVIKVINMLIINWFYILLYKSILLLLFWEEIWCNFLFLLLADIVYICIGNFLFNPSFSICSWKMHIFVEELIETAKAERNRFKIVHDASSSCSLCKENNGTIENRKKEGNVVEIVCSLWGIWSALVCAFKLRKI